MAGSTVWTIEGGGVKVTVTATIVGDNVEFKIELVEGQADLNGIFFDWDSNGGSTKNVGSSSNNMNGSDYNGNKLNGFDDAEALGSVGGNDADYTEGTVTRSIDSLKVIYGDLTDEELLEALAGATIGIRATSVGEDREGSLKLTGTGEYDPGDDDCTDFFPDMDKGISHVTFVWSYDPETASEELKAMDKNGDGYITVKIDIPGAIDEEPFDLGECGNDLDTWYKAALADIYASDDYKALADATLEGAYIKSGKDAFGPDDDPDIWDGEPGKALNSLAYFSVEDVDTNDNGNDPRPDGMGTVEQSSSGKEGTPGYQEFVQLVDYADGHTFGFDPDWVPAECADCIA